MSRTSQLKEKIAQRQEMERQERRESILAAARKVFFEKGYLSASMRDIALEASLSPGLLYHYFQGKDELYGVICEEAFYLMLEYFHKVEKMKGPARDKLVAIAKAYVQYFLDHPEYFDIVSFRDLGFKKVDISSPILERIEALSYQALDVLRKQVEESMAEGSIKHADDLWETTMSLWAPVEGLIFIEKRGYLKTFSVDLDKALDGVLTPLLEGLKP